MFIILFFHSTCNSLLVIPRIYLQYRVTETHGPHKLSEINFRLKQFLRLIFINVTGNILFIRDDLAVTGTKQDGCSDKETMCTSETQILVTMTITQTQPKAR